MILLFFSPIHAQPPELLTGEIILKMKEEARPYCQPDKVDLKQITELLDRKGATWKGRWFPRHQKPEPGFLTASGEQAVDLSLMYQISLGSKEDIPALCRALSQIKLVAYAEPKIFHPPLYNPNDTLADSLSGIQWQLRTVRAYEAWNIHRGDTGSFAGILDSGTLFDHIDLKGNEKYNELDTLDGLDNDGNGFIDDFRGWNYSENNNNPTWNWNSHGVRVIGAAFAKTDNVTLMAGNAFNCKYLPVKVYGPFNGAPFTGFESIVYAADRGAKVINLSWGSELAGFLQYEQDVINYAAINRDVVVVAAAGNTAAELDFYPAAYRNVVSVGQTNSQDHLAPFATWSTSIDLSAPAFGLPMLSANGSFQYDQGSSFGAPQVAAAALLLRSYRPHLSAKQAAAQVRITADVIDTMSVNQAYRGKLGKGRLNMYRMLADTAPPGFELEAIQLLNTNGKHSDLQAGDTVFIFSKWVNRLNASGPIQLKLSSSSAFIQILTDTVSLNPTPGGGLAEHGTQPLRMLVLANAPINELAQLRFDLTGTNYADFAHHRVFLNADFIRFDAGRLQVTLSSRGRNGHNDRLNTQGWGITFEGNQLAYESGLMIGENPSRTSDVIRIDFFNRSNDFKYTDKIKRHAVSYADEAATCRFEDSTLAAMPLKVAITQRAMRWDTADQVIVLEYELKNLGQDTLDSLYLGQFNDWDIFTYENNATFWDSTFRLAYTRNNLISGKVAGIRWLYGSSPTFYGIDGFNQTTGGINITDQFSKSEKFQSMSSGIVLSGVGSSIVTDIQQVTAMKMEPIAPGGSRRVTLAYLADSSLNALKQASLLAADLYRKARQGATPALTELRVCPGDSLFQLFVPGVQQLAVYADSLGQQLLYRGSVYQSTAQPTSFRVWISNEDSLFPSPLSGVNIIKNPLFANIQSSTDSLIEGVDTVLLLSGNGAYNRWILPNGDSLIGGNVSIRFSQLVDTNASAQIRITLFATDSFGCTDTSSVLVNLVRVMGIEGLKSMNKLSIYPNPAYDRLYVDGLYDQDLIRVLLINTSGQNQDLGTIKRGEQQLTIYLPDKLANGLYLLRIETKKSMITHPFLLTAP